MDKSRLSQLLQRYSDGDISIEELKELFAAMREQGDDNQALKEQLSKVWQNYPGTQPQSATDWEKMYQQITNTPVIRLQRKIITLRRIAVAASVLFIVAVSAYLITSSKKQAEVAPLAIKNDIAPPDRNRASLTLTTGEIIYLDSLGKGTIAAEQNVIVSKTDDGSISYNGTQPRIDSLAYNTLSNRRGSTVINLNLADGSRVWLNAGSSITYPVAFTGNERKVKISGEAYFEVAHDDTKPFFVSKDDATVQVLGTHFNVNAYDDEADIKVTLLEGSVRFIKGAGMSNSLVLRPGQQAIATYNDQLSINNNADLEQVMAWKNNLFLLKKADIKTIMRQIERWYDVEIEYKGEINDRFIMKIARNTNVSDVFRILEATGVVQFRIEGRKITVLPVQS